MSKNILDIDDDGGDVLFEEEKTSEVVPVIGKKLTPPPVVEEQIIRELEVGVNNDKLVGVAEVVASVLGKSFDVVVEEDKLIIKEAQPIEELDEPELNAEEKIDLILQISRRQMQELDELRQHVFMIEQQVTQRCLVVNLLSNMKKFILGGSNGRV